MIKCIITYNKQKSVHKIILEMGTNNYFYNLFVLLTWLKIMSISKLTKFYIVENSTGNKYSLVSIFFKQV